MAKRRAAKKSVLPKPVAGGITWHGIDPRTMPSNRGISSLVDWLNSRAAHAPIKITMLRGIIKPKRKNAKKRAVKKALKPSRTPRKRRRGKR
jgi:hypothetical protein